MNSNWQYKIQQHTETPPAGAWLNIANVLDADAAVNENNFALKLQTFQTAAPAPALKNIFALLDEEEIAEKKIAERLYHYTTPPPAKVWPVIENQLSNTARVITLKNYTKNRKLFYSKIAAAAAVLIIAGAVLINSKKSSGIRENTTAAALPQQQNQTADTGAGSTNLLTPEAQQKSTPIASTSPAPVKPAGAIQQTVTVNPPALISSVNTTELATNPAFAPKEKLQNSEGETPMDIALMNTPNSYITISGPDGQMIKVSSKFSNLISYLTEDGGTQENLDVIIKESAKWRATFAKWRSRMANNSVAPSVTNFMDIIELSSMLEEKDK